MEAHRHWLNQLHRQILGQNEAPHVADSGRVIYEIERLHLRLSAPLPAGSVRAGMDSIAAAEGPAAMLADYWRYSDTTPEERDREIKALCRTAIWQWLALPEDRRSRWPLEPALHAEEILRRWAREFRDRGAESPWSLPGLRPASIRKTEFWTLVQRYY